MVTLGQLLRERRKNCFDLLRVPLAKTAATLVFGGDVMLGRSCAAKIESGIDPFAGIEAVLQGASFAAANLECTISNLGGSAQRYAFRAPARSAQLLRAAGFHAMGLANNHALDFGTAALRDCAASLFSKKSSQLELEHQQAMLTRRVSSQCSMEKTSRSWRSATSEPLQALKSPQQPIEPT